MSFLRSFSRGKATLDLSKRSPAVRSLVDRTVAYLTQRSAENPNAQIRPAMLAQAIGENEMLALTALSILEDAGITRAHFGLYCEQTMQPMRELAEGESAPETLWCDACGRDHELDAGEIQKEIFFTFDPNRLNSLKEAA